MPSPRRFLIVDDIADSRALVVRTLLRKFPTALVQESQESATALAAVAAENFDLVVAHRAADVDGLTLIRLLRQAHATVPVLMISGLDRSREALAAGATAFHNYDEWLRIGTVVAELLAPPPAPKAVSPARPAGENDATAAPRA
jgi:CheY-like chemotaxis protein